ncbi:hypothetical protein BHE74_00047919 [Ensete ventricosum]|nr:hypothetical protein GW17_00033012 [Ensete ventricosum]RWW46175.1 hypothetical protein BHE74_00047919 [Ensete ventricosum]RZS16421.1 hypothetical protein BHM03_00048408 [Ensete ventricosum]
MMYKRSVMKFYNMQVQPRHLKVGDRVLHRMEISDLIHNKGKLAPIGKGHTTLLKRTYWF